jgi:hypothetical protein
MAFNPFHWFRKHQKAAFAGLIIVCMFVFIASFGVGDAVQQLLGLVRKQQQGDVVATVYGDKVHESELTDLARKRDAASTFLFYASGTFPPRMLMGPLNPDYTKPLDDLLEGDLKEPPEALAALKKIVRDTKEEQLQLTKYAQAKAQHLSMNNRGAVQIIETQAASRANNIRNSLIRDLRDLAGKPAVREDPKSLELVRKVALLVGHAYHRALMIARPIDKMEDLYFGGNARKLEDLLDFLIWKKQADKLGINLTDQDLRKEINREAGFRDFLKKDDFARDPEVKKFIPFYQGPEGRRGRRQKGIEGTITEEELREAVRDEFRVAYAQSAVLGLERGARSYRELFPANLPPSFGTPDEFLRFFRDRRTTLKVRLLPLPIEKFRNDPRVTSRQPTDADLRELYEKNKEREPSPARREPGFKRPQRVAFAYVTAMGKDEESRQTYRSYYLRPSRRIVEVEATGAVQAVTGVRAVIPTGPGALGWLAALAYDPVADAHESYRRQNDYYWQPVDNPDTVALDRDAKRLPDSSTLRPDNVALMIVGNMHPGGVLAGVTTWYQAGACYKQQEDLAFQAQYLLARAPLALPGTFSPASTTLAVAHARAMVLPHPLKAGRKVWQEAFERAAVRPVVLAQMGERLAESTLRANRGAYATEVAKLKDLPDENEKLAQARKKAEDFHFGYHQMPGPRSRQEILADLRKGDNELDLAALHENYTPGATPEQFVKELFNPRTLRAPGLFEPVPFHPTRLEEIENGYFWRTREVPSEVMKFAAVYDEVREAWYLDKARAVARAEARRLEEQVNEQRKAGKSVGAILANLEKNYADRFGPMFQLTDVAKLVRPKGVQFTMYPGAYSEYHVPPDLRNKFPYPPANLVDELMKLEAKGQATVIADRPARTFYLAILEKRDDQTGRNLEEYHKAFREGTKPDGPQDQLYRLFREWQAGETYKRAMEQLRREALKDDSKIGKDGTYTVSDDLRRRVEGRSDTESDRRREEEE